MKQFKEKFLSGVKWSAFNQLIAQLIGIGISIKLARLLNPKVFGTIGMITVLSGFAQLFITLGVNKALIQQKGTRLKQLSTAFWLNMMLGGAMAMTFFVSAPFIASFYDKPELKALARSLSVVFLIGPLGTIHSTLLVKKIQFKYIAVANTTSIFIAGLAALGLAYWGLGVWSLVWQAILNVSINTVMLWSFSSWRPVFYFKWKEVKSLIGFGGYITANSVLNYWARNFDNLLIAKVLGDHSLGVYNRSYSLMMLPLSNISSTIARVMFPSLSSIQDDKERIKKIYLKVTQSIALITFPLMAGLWVLSDLFVLTLLGEQWKEMIPLVKILCLLGISQSILTLNGTVYMSLKKADLAFKVGLFLKLNLFIGFAVGIYFGGLIGVCIGYVVASSINFFPSFYFASRLINLTLFEQAKNLFAIFLCALAMGVGVYWFKDLGYLSRLPQWAELITLVFTGVVIYFALILVFKGSILTEIWALIGKRSESTLKSSLK